MKKTELLAALQADEFDREALIKALTVEGTKRYRDQPEAWTLWQEFKTHRTEQVQPAFFAKDGSRLAEALRGHIAAIYDLAEACGLDLDPDADADAEAGAE